MGKLIDQVCKLFEVLIALCLAVMVVLVFGNVVLRYGFDSSIAMSDEISRWLFIWVTFLGAVIALHKNEHLGMDMVVDRLPVLGRKICLVLGHAVMLGVAWLLFSGSWDQVKLNIDVEAPSTGAPMAIVYAPGVVFSVLAAVILLLNLGRALTGRLDDSELIMVQSSEEASQMEILLGSTAANQHGAASGGGNK